VVRQTKKNRLQEELRERRKKVVRLSVMLLVVVVAGVVLSLVYLEVSKSQYLPIRFVKVEGEFRYLKSERLEQLLNQELNKGFFNIDIDTIHAAVQQVPWVDSVTVRRKWPDTLMLNVVEQKPLARWSKGGYVNQRGEWFLASQEGDQGAWPVLEGPKGSEYLLSKEYLFVSNQLMKFKLGVKRLTVNHRRSWQLSLDNGLNLQLGRMQVQARLQRFLDVYKMVIAEQLQKIESVDMRYTNGFAVRWKSEPDSPVKKKGAHNNA